MAFVYTVHSWEPIPFDSRARTKNTRNKLEEEEEKNDRKKKPPAISQLTTKIVLPNDNDARMQSNRDSICAILNSEL